VTLPLVQDFVEGTSGTTLTTGNTSGSGQNAFNSTSIGSGSTAAFSNAQTVLGTGLSAVFATSAAGNASFVSWTSTSIGSQGTVYGRAYIYLSALPATDDNLIHFANSGTNAGGIMVGSSGQLRRPHPRRRLRLLQKIRRARSVSRWGLLSS